jgi:hypothetical protein
MIMESNLSSFLQLKNHKDCKDLDINVITFILELFENNESKKNKKYIFNNNSNYKKSNQILKNPKIKLIKEKISNKVNLILNKLSENNLSNLLIEFFNNIKILNIDDFNEVIKTIYIKMVTEINFLKLYLDFFKNIIGTYKYIYSYNISYFYDLLECKFNFDYNDLEDITMDFLKDYDTEDFRLNNLTIIKELIQIQFFNSSFEEYINNKILNQTKYYSDIYYWFKNSKLSNEQVETISNIINNINIDIRDKILLQNLISEYIIEPKKSKLVFKKKKIVNSFESKVETLINEYLTDDLNTELNLSNIENFILVNCVETADKNKFCEIILSNYFLLNNSNKIIELIKYMVVEQILFKSNFSRGLLSLYNLGNEYNQNKENLLLQTLKSLGITKGLETLLSKHNIEITI